jgi:peroxiredoxin
MQPILTTLACGSLRAPRRLQLLSDAGVREVQPLACEGEALWLARKDLPSAIGWEPKPEGLCRADTCIPVPAALARADAIDVAGLWRQRGAAVLHDAARVTWLLGEPAADRAAQLRSLEAPDFALPDLDGRLHSLREQRGRKVLLVTWSSWCGCRLDLPIWQKLYEELGPRGFTVVAVAMDSRTDAARPWIEAARPTYPVLIDRDHRVADLYAMVNVPQAVWIDEAGKVVRPVETAGAYERFRSMDRTTRQVPEQEAERGRWVRSTYLAALRDWVARGADSPHACADAAARSRVPAPDASVARAHACFRLGQHLQRAGKPDEGRAFVEEAIRLHPDSWNMWRQHAEPLPNGIASGPAFWARVDALGERRYYALIDMQGMPEQLRN